jgi:tricorn protease
MLGYGWSMSLIGKLLSARVFLILVLLTVSSTVLSGPLNLHHPAPSPDGSKVCFSYQGDLWIVSAQGGKAQRMTVHVGYDAYPKWSPDGNFIAFSSQRYGNYDVFVIPAIGGIETRVTYHSADDLVSGWSADSRRILFTSQRDHPYQQVWEVSAIGGRAKPLTTIESFDGRKSPDGTRLLFTRGAVPYWRKGYRGTAACDLFLKDLTSGTIVSVTQAPSNERDGFWSPSGSEVLFLSDSTGVYSLFKKNLVSGQVTQLTNHRLSISHLSVAQDASLAAYELGGEIFLYDFKTGQGRKLELEASAAAKTNAVEHVTFDSDVSNFAISPDGKLLAYVVHGDIFCRDLSGNYQQQLTSDAANERDLFWSPDSKQLAFVSDRDLVCDIYLARSTDLSQSSLARSHDCEIAPFVKSDLTKRVPLISPDQSKLAFIRGETELVIKDIKKLTERVLTEKGAITSLDWSPDGRYIVFTRIDADWHSQVYIGDSESGAIYKISDEAGSYDDPRFSADGRLVYYVNDNDLHYLYLERRLAEMAFFERQEYAEKNATKNALGLPTVMIDFEGIADRDVQLTHQGNIESTVMSPNSSTLLYITSAGQIERVNLDGSDQRVVTSTLPSPSGLQFSPRGEIVYVRDGKGRIQSVNLQDGTATPLLISGEMDIDRKQEMTHVFDQVWATLKVHFYDPTMHGVDWNGIRETYLLRVQAATESNDLYDIISEMIGELDCSHIMIWRDKPKVGETGMLGILPDYDDNSAGLKVKYILSGSPATRLSSELRLEDKITAVEGKKLNANVDYYEAFENTVGTEIKLDIFSRDGISRSVLITPVSAEDCYDFEYRDNLARTRRLVDNLSNKKLAYIHLKQMDNDGMNGFENELAQQLDGKQGLILDIRGNVGGNNHEKLLECLSRKPYVTHKTRDGDIGQDARGAITMPIVLLTDENTTSDAEIFALGFRELGLGTIMGTTTYGAVVGAKYYLLVNGWRLGVPTVGWYSLKGEALENNGVAPDIVVTRDLSRLERGEDNQLEEAVKYLTSKIK